MSSGPKPWISLTPTTVVKLSVSVSLMAAGMHYLVTGRREADFSRMVTGAVLSLASVFILAL